METNILMESGTNELEVLEFTVGNNHYGINVAKIKEIVQYSPVTPVPNSHPCVEGIFMPRDLMITVVDLAKVIKAQPSPDITKDMFIITNFNQLNVAFHVHSVVGIHRVSWADIIKPDSTISTADSGIATGIVKIDNQLIGREHGRFSHKTGVSEPFLFHAELRRSAKVSTPHLPRGPRGREHSASPLPALWASERGVFHQNCGYRCRPPQGGPWSVRGGHTARRSPVDPAAPCVR